MSKLIIAKLIQSSKALFFQYVSLKEALFLESLGSKSTKRREDEVLQQIQEKTAHPKHIQILIRFFGEKVTVSSSDQEKMDYRGVMADFAWRGSEPGPISITRTLEGREVTITLSPGEKDQEYLLSLFASPDKGLACQLFVEGELEEELQDVSKQRFFHTPLSNHNNSELKFLEKGKIIFTIGLFLQSS